MSSRIQPKMMVIAVFAFVGLGLAALAENVVMAQGDKVVTVTEKDAGKKIKLGKGDTLVVRLEAQSGTAFTWKIAKNDEALLKPQGKLEIERPEKPLPGGKVTHVFRLRAEAAGASELTLDYARPFDKDKAPAKSYKIEVTVE